MWCLPSIQKLNEDAAKNANKFLKAVRTHKLNGELIRCEHCDGEADVVYPYFDIFSDDPKGVIGLCSEHDEYFGNPTEGFFTCDSCGRVMVENYTWELYSARDGETDEVLCLTCHAERELSKGENWIQLRDDRIDQVDFNEIRACKHLLAVNQPVPKSIAFIENVEMDSMSGGRLTSFSSSECSPDGAVEEIKSILLRLKAQGYAKAILVLDAAYQFSVSNGIYVSADDAAALAGGTQKAA